MTVTKKKHTHLTNGNYILNDYLFVVLKHTHNEN